MTSFKSTAAFYSRYRVPYPESLPARLKADAGLGHDSLVQDLATGPGRLALALAPSVREVVAVDIEPEMLAEGRRLAHGLRARGSSCLGSRRVHPVSPGGVVRLHHRMEAWSSNRWRPVVRTPVMLRGSCLCGDIAFGA